MRKGALLFIVLAMSISLSMWPSVSLAAAKKPRALTLLSGVAGGSWFPIGAAVSEIFRKAGVRANAEPGGAASNIIALHQGKAELGFTMSFVPALARKGVKPFPTKIVDVAGVAVLFDNFTHILVLKEAGINAVSDLKGKPFATQRLGTGTQVAFSDVLKAYGMSEKSLKLTRGSQSEGGELVKDKHVVGMTATTAAPGGTFVDLLTSKPVKLLSLPPTKIQELQKINQGYSEIRLPANTYPGQTEPVLGIGTATILTVRANMSANEVYWITKTLAEHIEAIRAAHSTMKRLTVTQMSKVKGLPLHPGAARYYKEALK